MSLTVAEARRHFPSSAAEIFFDHASISPVSTDVARVVCEVMERQALTGFQTSWLADIEDVRSQAAALVHSTPQDIAFTQNTSFGLSLVANGIDWQPGDNLVLPAREFPSNYYPWMNLRRRGIEVRLVDAPLGHADLGEVMAAMDERTRVVAVSAVQFSTGFRYDLRPLGAACQASRSLLVVDGTQCVGALAFDVGDCGADVLAVSSHKWLMGPPGAGFTHISSRAREQVHPSVVGWLTVPEPFAFDYQLTFPEAADRYEPGTENVAGTLGMGAAIRLLLEFTPAWVEQRVLSITDRLVEGLRSRGYDVLSDRSPSARSGIVIFRHPGCPAEDVLQRLLDAGVKCVPRGGGVRFSPHFYNTDEEADTALAVL